MQCLKNQNKVLSRLLQLERTRAERARSELVQRISGLLGDFVEERDRGLREAIVEIQNNAAQREAAVLVSLKSSDDDAQASSNMHSNWQNSLGHHQRNGLKSQETFEEACLNSPSIFLVIFSSLLLQASAILMDSFENSLPKLQEQLTVAVSYETASVNKHARDISSSAEQGEDDFIF